jgi:hypothetical protein
MAEEVGKEAMKGGSVGRSKGLAEVEKAEMMKVAWKY